MVTVKFVSGKERGYNADSAALSGPLFVLYKYNRTRRKSESADCFPAEEVVQAEFSDGRIVVGRGRVRSD